MHSLLLLLYNVDVYYIKIMCACLCLCVRACMCVWMCECLCTCTHWDNITTEYANKDYQPNSNIIIVTRQTNYEQPTVLTSALICIQETDCNFSFRQNAQAVGQKPSDNNRHKRYQKTRNLIEQTPRTLRI